MALIPTPTIIARGIPISVPIGNGKLMKHIINVRNAAQIPIMMKKIFLPFNNLVDPIRVLELYDRQHVIPHNSGGYHFYSLSIYSSMPGGSGARPFLFLISAIAVVAIDFGSSVHALKEVFHVARPAV